MPDQPIRIVASKNADDSEAMGRALAYAKAVAEKRKISEPNMILLTHTKQQLDHTTVASMLGDQASNALRNNKSIRLGSGGYIHNETMRTMPRYGSNAIVIVCYGESKILDFVDGISGLAGVVVIPDLEGSASSWVARWNPLVFGEERAAAKPLLDDQVVENALTTLLAVVNPSTGVGHPRDKAMGDEILRILRAKGHRLDADAIKSWAIQNNWSPDNAESLAKIARKVDSLKSRPKISSYHDPHGRYARWKDQV